MALSGSFTGSTGNQFVQPKITWSATQDVASNTSTVKATLTYSRTNTGYTTYGTWSGSLTINGNKNSGSKYIEITYNSNTVAISHTVKVTHNDDGTKSITISASGGINGISASTTSISKTVTLDTIARKSSVSAGSANVGSGLKITITRASSSFTHDLWYKFDGVASSWTKITSSKVGASHTWTIPTSFYAAMATVKSKSGTLLCRTYSGDTEIGDAECSFTANVPQASSLSSGNVTFTAVNTDTSKTGSVSTILKGENDVKATISATASNSATIKSIKVENGSTSSSSTYSAATANKTYTFSKPIIGVFKATVTDSRGYSVEKTVTLNVIEYFKPTIAVTASKMNTSGRVDVTINGTAFNGSINSTTNSRRVYWRVGRGSWTEITANTTFSTTNFSVSPYVTGLDYRTTYTVQAKIVDSVQTVESKAVTVSCIPIFDWSKDDFQFNVPVTFNAGFSDSGSIVDMIYPVGSIYMSVNSTNPATLFGGTWVAWGSGRVPVGVNTGDGNFNSVEKTGGSNTVTLSSNQIPAHSHLMRVYSNDGTDEDLPSWIMWVADRWANTGAIKSNGSSTTNKASHSKTSFGYTTDTGGSQAHSNLQPYITCYMWKRTA